MNHQEQAIVITGCGWVTPFAAGGLEAVLQAAAGGTAPPAVSEGYWPVPDQLMEGYPDLSSECRNDPGAWLTAVAFELARRDSSFVPGSVPPERVGLVLGDALAGQSGMIDFANDVREQSARFVSPIRFPQTVGNYISGALARAYDIRGPNSTIANGPASGLDAVVEACSLLSAGKADLVFAGGTERLTPALAMGLAEPGVMFSDGACLFVLQRSDLGATRGPRGLARVVFPRESATGDHSEPRAERSPGTPGARATASPSERVLSVAGTREPGAIYIEHWTGRCLGALGAAAVAAAIGAARGLPVPYVSEADSTLITVSAFKRESLNQVGENVRAVVRAASHGGPPATIELAIPP